MCRQCLGAREVPPPFILLTLLPVSLHFFVLSTASRIRDSYPGIRQFGGVSFTNSCGMLWQIRTKLSDLVHASRRARAASASAGSLPLAEVETINASDVDFLRSFIDI
jgi:hypothetical protein